MTTTTTTTTPSDSEASAVRPTVETIEETEEQERPESPAAVETIEETEEEDMQEPLPPPPIRQGNADAASSAASSSNKTPVSWAGQPSVIKTPTRANASLPDMPKSAPNRRLLRPRAVSPKPPGKPQKNAIYDWLSQGILLAGGATSKYLLFPPLQLFRSLIWEIATPRIRAWLGVLETAFGKAWEIVSATPVGKRWTVTLKRYWLEGVPDVLTHASSRQLLLDGMATSVKLAEALDTPEFRVLLQQLGVLGCRITDAVSSGATKKLIHDGCDLLWDTIDVWSDPTTTLALAEITATICKALEDLHTDRNRGDRSRRDAYQTRTYVDPQTIHDPNVTVEEAILSSLGHTIPQDDDLDSVPETGSHQRRRESTSRPDKEFLPSQVPSDILVGEGGEVDVEFLKENIDDRAANLKEKNSQQRFYRSANDDDDGGNGELDGNTDMEDLNVKDINPRYSPTSVLPTAEDISSRQRRRDGETAAAHFYRILDDALVQRQKSVQPNWMPRAAAAAGAGNEYGQDSRRGRTKIGMSIPETLDQIKDIPVRLDKFLLPKGPSKWRKRLILCAIGFVSFMSVLWTILGFYGAYIVVVGSLSSPKIISEHMQPNTVSQQSEIVIRIVRQVVHVREDENGNEVVMGEDEVQGGFNVDPQLSSEQVEKIAECASGII